MRNYSYCFRKKGSKEYISSGVMHELEFLDYMSMQFRDKEHLMTFLGVNPEEYNDVAIKYIDGNNVKILPVLFGPVELDIVCRELVIEPFNYFVFDTLHAPDGYRSYGDLSEEDRIVIGYNYPETVGTYKDQGTLKSVRGSLKNVYMVLLARGIAEKAYGMGLISARAYRRYNAGDIEGYIYEISKDYLAIRNACIAAVKIGGASLRTSSVPFDYGFVNMTMKEAMEGVNPVFDAKLYGILKDSVLTCTEEDCITSFLFFGNNLFSNDPDREPVDAYNALKKLSRSSNRLDTILNYIDERQKTVNSGNIKKFGTIVDN